MSDFYVILVYILMPPEEERWLQFYDFKEIYHIFIQSVCLAFAV